MDTIKYHVPNISCAHCVHTIQLELSELDGVEQVIANEAQQTVEVAYKPPASDTAIRSLLAEINYPVA